MIIFLGCATDPLEQESIKTSKWRLKANMCFPMGLWVKADIPYCCSHITNLVLQFKYQFVKKFFFVTVALSLKQDKLKCIVTEAVSHLLL